MSMMDTSSYLLDALSLDWLDLTLFNQLEELSSSNAECADVGAQWSQLSAPTQPQSVPLVGTEDENFNLSQGNKFCGEQRYDLLSLLLEPDDADGGVHETDYQYSYHYQASKQIQQEELLSPIDSDGEADLISRDKDFGFCSDHKRTSDKLEDERTLELLQLLDNSVAPNKEVDLSKTILAPITSQDVDFIMSGIAGVNTHSTIAEQPIADQSILIETPSGGVTPVTIFIDSSGSSGCKDINGFDQNQHYYNNNSNSPVSVVSDNRSTCSSPLSTASIDSNGLSPPLTPISMTESELIEATNHSIQSDHRYSKAQCELPSSFPSLKRAAPGGVSGAKSCLSEVDDEKYRPKPYDRPYKNGSKSGHSPEDILAERKARKQRQNKEAATRYREKKKAEEVAKHDEMETLESRNEELRSQVSDVRNEIQYLKKLLADVYTARGLPIPQVDG